MTVKKDHLHLLLKKICSMYQQGEHPNRALKLMVVDNNTVTGGNDKITAPVRMANVMLMRYFSTILREPKVWQG